jgi:hypothetical protein
MAFESWSSATGNKIFQKGAKLGGLRHETSWRRRAVREAQTNHTWAKYAPGVARVTGELKIDVKAARAAKLALS